MDSTPGSPGSMKRTIEGLQTEIIERQHREEALRAEGEKFRSLFELSRDVILMVDLSGQILDINPSAEQLTGYSRSELKRMNVFQHLLVPEDHELVRGVLADLGKGKPRSYQYRWKAKNGATIYFEGSSVPRFSAAGEFLSTLCVLRDITERRRAEGALRQSESNFRTLAEKSLQGIIIGRDWNIFYANPAHLANFGYTMEELQSMSAEQLKATIHPDDRPIVEERVRKRLARERLSPSLEVRIVRKDGSTRWLQFFNNEIEYNGQPAFLSTSIDITERKNLEIELRRSEEELRRVVNAIPALVWSAQPDGSFDFINQTHMEFTGLSLDEVRDWRWTAIIHPDDRESLVGLWRKGLETGERFETEARLRRRGGDYRWLRIRAVPLRDVQGNIVKWYGTKTDITISKEAEEEIRRHAARMEALAEISRAFVEVGLDYRGVLNTVARRTAELIGDACVMTRFSDDGQRSYPVAFYHRDPKALIIMHKALIHTWQGGTDTLRYQTLLSGNSIFTPEVNTEVFRASLEPEFRDFFDIVGISSLIIVPLQVQGRVIGTLGLTRDRQGSSYTSDDQVLLQDIADRAALTVQNAKTYENLVEAEKRLHESREQLRALSAKLQSIREEEKTRIAREIHDDLGQKLTSLKIDLVWLESKLRTKEKELAQRFRAMQELIDSTVEDVQRMATELRPGILDDLGLTAALEWQSTEFQKRTGIQCEFIDHQEIENIDSDAATATFRIFQEALTNVARHSHATKVSVRLTRENGILKLTVSDNGRGITESEMNNLASLGIMSMRERALALDGTLTIEGGPQKGTTILVAIPAKQNKTD